MKQSENTWRFNYSGGPRYELESEITPLRITRDRFARLFGLLRHAELCRDAYRSVPVQSKLKWPGPIDANHRDRHKHRTMHAVTHGNIYIPRRHSRDDS